MEKIINRVHHSDVIIFLKKLLKHYGEGFADLVLADFPYFEVVDEDWDNQWASEENYLEWYREVIILVEKCMKSNANLIPFNNNFEMLSRCQETIRTIETTHLKFSSLITWNKKFFKWRNGKFEKCDLWEFLNGFIVKNKKHSLEKMCEYIVVYNLDNTYKIKNALEKANITQSVISEEILSKRNNKTGWFSNILLGKNYPTIETIKPITKHLGLEYDDLVPKFNNIKKNHSVWDVLFLPSDCVIDFEIADRIIVTVKNIKSKFHVTPKPIPLIERLLRYYSNEGDLVLNLFSGTGNHEKACQNLNRAYIGCDFKKIYVDYANECLKSRQKTLTEYFSF